MLSLPPEQATPIISPDLLELQMNTTTYTTEHSTPKIFVNIL